MAWPCFPEDLLLIYLIGSIGSMVGPLVTIADIFFRAFDLARKSVSDFKIFSTYSILLSPIFPQANFPDVWLFILIPDSFNILIFL